MVLWELTLATAYFLGLKRAYRLALKLEQKLFHRYPRALGFAQRRTRNVFDIACRIYREIQRRDLEAGQSLGNWILQMLDRTRPPMDVRACVADKQSTDSGASGINRQAHSSDQHTKAIEPPKGSNLSAGNLKLVRAFLNHNTQPLIDFRLRWDLQRRVGSNIPKILIGGTSSTAAMSLPIYATTLEKNSKYVLQSHSAIPASSCRFPFVESGVSRAPCLRGVAYIKLAKTILASCRR